jgi:aromatic-L-amino-acid decarboxylase
MDGFRTFGREGLQARIREHCRLARLFASWVEADADFEVLAPVKMAVVCFRARTKDFVRDEQLNNLNQTLVERVNATGEAYLTHTRLHGKVVARLAVGNVLTTEKHLMETWALISNELASLRRDTRS